ncbi:peptidylprolyl isomerase [Candidatus Hydrogenosomobacter endosymbioticus]|nr:peptidyl-prolyl cis-trans isomerase [Candidatus Hydrogenosomobacter endosymbioticus]
MRGSCLVFALLVLVCGDASAGLFGSKSDKAESKAKKDSIEKKDSESSAKETKEGSGSSDIACVVNGEKIARSKVLESLKGAKDPAQKTSMYRESVGRLVFSTAVLQSAKKSGIANSPEFKQILDMLTNEVLVKMFISSKQKAIKDSISKDVLEKKMDEIQKMGGDQIRLQQIVVFDKQKAEQIRKAAASNGKDFMKLAQQYSAAKDDIDLGWKAAFTMGDVIGKAAANSIEIIPDKNGAFRIIKIAERRKLSDRALLAQLAGNILFESALKEFFAEIRDKAEVVVYDVDGKKVSDAKKWLSGQ